jgi:hypothetical protein
MRNRAAMGSAFVLGSILVGAASAQGATPLDPPRQYLARGEALLNINGPRCCGNSRLTGRFDASYTVDSGGQVRLGHLRAALDDLDVVVSDGFLGLFDKRITLRCVGALTTELAVGHLTGRDIDFAAGTMAVVALSSEERRADGSCGDRTLRLEARNDVATRITHDPVANVFAWDGRFRSSLDGEDYDLTLQLTGRFANRPPTAAAGVLTSDLPQGGCPARWRFNGQTWEQVAEANSPQGLVAYPYSLSSDVDGAWAHGNVSTEQWFRVRDAGPRLRIGHGRLLPLTVFEWGPRHALELLAADQVGATSASACRFRVIDTRPPVVTAPAPVTLACSTPGGATRATSAPLRTFLGSAAVSDAADPSPVLLAPQTGGLDITDSTLFPVAASRSVSFRARDTSGNVGSAVSSVTVTDSVLPTVSLTVSPAFLPADFRYHPITATLTASDNCGGVTLKLVSITSNAPSYDASDIRDASFGTDDRGFFLFGRRAAGTSRVYKIAYEGRDAAGNRRTVTANVVVS